MDAKKREIRNLECQLAFREASGEASEKGILGTITGRAICFNAESQILDEWGQTFREVIAPEAATMEFLNTQDIKINMLHSRELTFGRAKRGTSGNARLSVDEQGVNFEVDVPNCDLGIRARELTKAGVYDGCSFEFWPDKYDIEEREGGIPLVRHTKFKAITALTLGMDPAYLQTSLSARELMERETKTADSDKVEKEKETAEEAAKEEEKTEELSNKKAAEDADNDTTEDQAADGDTTDKEDDAKREAEEQRQREEAERQAAREAEQVAGRNRRRSRRNTEEMFETLIY